MTRKLANVCVVLALMMGCWGGVLAAVACPHMACKTAASAPAGVASHDEHSSGHEHEAVAHEDHSGHVQTHEGHAEPAAQGKSQVSTGELWSVAPEPHDPSCAHCVSRSEAPPSPCFEWQPNSVRKGGELAAPVAAATVTVPAAAYVREITPAQHAPPGRTDRHLLLSVFRI